MKEVLLYMGWLRKTSKKGIIDQRSERKGRALVQINLGKNVLGLENCKCQGPEMMCVKHSRGSWCEQSRMSQGKSDRSRDHRNRQQIIQADHTHEDSIFS